MTTAAELAASGRRASTLDTYRRMVEPLLERQPWPLSTEDVRDLVAEWSGAGLSASTMRLRVAAIQAALKGHVEGLPPGPPLNLAEIAPVLRGAALVAEPERRAKPLYSRHLRQIAHVYRDDVTDVRDLALLLVMWAGGLRASEVAQLDVDDVEFVPQGLEVTIRVSKRGRNEIVCIAAGTNPQTCPVRALHAWLDLRGGEVDGVRTPALWIARTCQRLCRRSIDDVVRRAVKRIGLGAGYSTHSLRAGVATEAAERGRELGAIAAHLRHRKLDTTRIYTDRGQRWGRNPVAGLL